MNTRGAKRLLLGLAVILFSLVLMFAGVGVGAILIVWVAIIVGIVGLAVAYVGFSRDD